MPSVFETMMADQLKGTMFPVMAVPSCIYTPPNGGAPVPGLSVRVQRGDAHEVEGAAGDVGDLQTATLIVLQADLASAEKGGRFTAGSEVWSIGTVPTLKNGEWICSCVCRGIDGMQVRRAKSNA